MYYLGVDLGSSSVKVALVDSNSGKSIAVVTEPKTEMKISALQKDWAEQDPETWWKYVCAAIKNVLVQTKIQRSEIIGVGISYQMHGLVLVDKQKKLLRDSIIWCDSRAVKIGEKAFIDLGVDYATNQLLNSPANFTASKLRWVQENEPELYKKIFKFMLPGDYIAMRFSDKINTSISGLSEGILWNFKKNSISSEILEYYGINKNMIPEVVNTFSEQSNISAEASEECGLAPGTPILYRAGDQPNNALSLNVLESGEIAVTGGTSGVIYAVTNEISAKETTRINSFAHVNHSGENRRIGKLLNINGAGILYRWLRENLAVTSYENMNDLAGEVEIGSDGVVIIPFGNGAERMLNNASPGMQILNVNYNIHDKKHLCRAALEGIAFSFVYGMKILKNDAVPIKVIRTGNDNLFRSELFSETICALIDQPIEVYNTTGAIGAARACGITLGDYSDLAEIVEKNDLIKIYKPVKLPAYTEAYNKWEETLENILNK